jgi:hypothetical protein
MITTIFSAQPRFLLPAPPQGEYANTATKGHFTQQALAETLPTNEATAEAPPSSVASSATTVAKKPVKGHSTPGLKAFDTIVYPIINNFLVFAISVYATYLTSHGNKVADPTKFFDIGHAFRARGNELVNWFKGEGKLLWHKLPSPFKLDHGAADMAKMVTFSFLDGSIVAILVALLENYSVLWARKLDNLLGTPKTEETEAAYRERTKHKQTVGSLFLGRIATCAIVVPTAVALNQKTHLFGILKKARSFNELLFNRPGLMAGLNLKKSYPTLQQKFPKIKLPTALKVIFFEGFYTGVCTAGLYGSSRLITGPLADAFNALMNKQNPTQPLPVVVSQQEPQSQYA